MLWTPEWGYGSSEVHEIVGQVNPRNVPRCASQPPSARPRHRFEVPDTAVQEVEVTGELLPGRPNRETEARQLANQLESETDLDERSRIEDRLVHLDRLFARDPALQRRRR